MLLTRLAIVTRNWVSSLEKEEQQQEEQEEEEEKKKERLFCGCLCWILRKEFFFSFFQF